MGLMPVTHSKKLGDCHIYHCVITFPLIILELRISAAAVFKGNRYQCPKLNPMSEANTWTCFNCLSGHLTAQVQRTWQHFCKDFMFGFFFV